MRCLRTQSVMTLDINYSNDCVMITPAIIKTYECLPNAHENTMQLIISARYFTSNHVMHRNGVWLRLAAVWVIGY